MGNIAIGGEYFPIPWYLCIPKVQSKKAYTVDEHYSPDIIGECAVAGRV